MSPSPRRGSLAATAPFVIGVPLGVGVLAAILHGPWQDSPWRRFVEHPVEQAEIVLFCCALTALAVKLLAWRRERSALHHELLPIWNGQAVATEQAKGLRDRMAQQPRRLQATWLGRRITGVLDFVHSRRSANELDDQLRTLADNDALEQDTSFSLLRLIIWAIPILGFLGTVIGITGAIAGVTPETLEQSLHEVTSGLSTAFDTTAVALLLTMILMFITFVVERLEQGVLQQVDAYADAELAHRFERTGPQGSPIAETLSHHAHTIARTAEQLVEKQAALWAQSLERMERRWSEASPRQFERMQHALERALEATLTKHAQHLRQTEEAFLARSQVLLEGLTHAAGAIHSQAAALVQLQDNEAQLLRLQEGLNNNLAAVANTGAFDQAVQSLSAAIHLLTTRVGAATSPRLSTKPAA